MGICDITVISIQRLKKHNCVWCSTGVSRASEINQIPVVDGAPKVDGEQGPSIALTRGCGSASSETRRVTNCQTLNRRKTGGVYGGGGGGL